MGEAGNLDPSSKLRGQRVNVFLYWLQCLALLQAC